jgi:rubrerythrin
MDIYEFALQMETESENYYRKLSKETENKGLKTIFNMLGDEEAKHYKIIEQIKNKSPQKVIDTPLLSDAKAVFEKMAADERFNFSKGQIEAYEKAQDIETKSKNFYLQKAGEVGETIQKEIFRKLAVEEEKHYFLLQNIIDFVSRPKIWLENAEWYHLEDY